MKKIFFGFLNVISSFDNIQQSILLSCKIFDEFYESK